MVIHITGYIHSFESLGAVDGPGIRFVIFMQGCPLRCAYCHNPDTWNLRTGTQYTIEQVAGKVLRYRPYFGKSGGVTLSGGEALSQPEFAAALFKRLRAADIHTTLDTSGICDLQKAKPVLEYTDLVMCDIKFSSEEMYKNHSGGSLAAVRRFLSLTADFGIPLWVRHVVVPGLTDGEQNIQEIIRIACEYPNLKKIELLPFKKLCTSKYEELKMDFPLRDTEECSQEKIEELSELIPQELR